MTIQQIHFVLFLYLYPEGRVGRGIFIAALVPLIASGLVVHGTVSMEGPSWFFLDCFLAMFAMILAVKRLADRGRPGWFLFLGLAPVAWLVVVTDIEIAHRAVWTASGYFLGWLTVWLAAELFLLPGRPSDVAGPGEISLAGGIDAFVDAVGRAVAWICIAQVLVVATNVILRYVLRIGPVALQELEWHMMSPIALIGMCYALRHNDHVKVDIFYERFHRTVREIVDLLAALTTIVISLLLIDIAAEFVRKAYMIDEGSPDPGGLPHRWLLRSFIPMGFAILALQAFANLIRFDLRAALRRRGAR